MHMILGIIAILFVIVSFIGTLIAGKQVNKKLKAYEQQGNTPADEILRSRHYEKKSVKRHGILLLIIWGITILIAVLGMTWYLL